MLWSTAGRDRAPTKATPPPSARPAPGADPPAVYSRARMGTITFDIEVAGFPWEEIDEITRGYLLGRARTPEDREAVPERTALNLGLGKVIAIGLWLVEEDRGMFLLEG